MRDVGSFLDYRVGIILENLQVAFRDSNGRNPRHFTRVWKVLSLFLCNVKRNRLDTLGYNDFYNPPVGKIWTSPIVAG